MIHNLRSQIQSRQHVVLPLMELKVFSPKILRQRQRIVRSQTKPINYHTDIQKTLRDVYLCLSHIFWNEIIQFYHRTLLASKSKARCIICIHWIEYKEITSLFCLFKELGSSMEQFQRRFDRKLNQIDDVTILAQFHTEMDTSLTSKYLAIDKYIFK